MHRQDDIHDSDRESCLQEQSALCTSLYENEDFVTNIRGPYQDKDYND